jgi:transposase
MLRMPGVDADAIDLRSLPAEVAALIERLQQRALANEQELARRDREIALARVRIDKLNFELARLKRWKFDAKTEAMTAAQRLLFAEVMAEDEASLQAKLAELQRGLPETPKTPKAPPRRPRRQALPEHLERVEHRHEPEDTTCPNADCGQPMQRTGEDVVAPEISVTH